MHRMLLCTALLFCFAAESEAQPPAAQTPEAQPTIEQLIAGVPVMSSQNPQMKRMRMTLHFPFGEDAYPVKATVDWVRGQSGGMLITASRSETPVAFVAQNQSVLFDAVDRKLVFDSEANPGLTFKVVGDAIKTTFQTKVKKDHTAIDVDLPSVIRGGRPAKQLQQTQQGHWKVSIVSDTGNTESIMIFDGLPPFHIRDFVVVNRKSGNAIWKLSEISINDQQLAPWPTFPQEAVFPEGLEVVREHGSIGNAQQATKVTIDLMSSVWAQVALDNKDLREKDLLSEIDWEALRSTNETFGPSLRYVLGFKARVSD